MGFVYRDTLVAVLARIHGDSPGKYGNCRVAAEVFHVQVAKSPLFVFFW
jgi:hypothetical protein